MKKLPPLLRQLRGKEPLRDAAKRADISHTYLSQLEKGIDNRTGKQIKPSTDVLKRLSKAYKYPYEKLLIAAGYLPEFKTYEKQPKDLETLLREGNVHYDGEILTEEETESVLDFIKVALNTIRKKK